MLVGWGSYAYYQDTQSRLKTLQENKNFLAGLNVFKGKVTYKGVADAFKLDYFSPHDLINQ